MDLIVGAWRNGLDAGILSTIEDVEARTAAGHRQLPYESTVRDLIALLDGYEEVASELLTENECACKD